MCSFKKTREVLVDCYMTDIISDEEFVLLYDASYSKNLELPYDDYGRFDLEEMADSECIAEFRVKKRDLPLLADMLQIPDSFVCDQGSVSEGMEGLCMLLRRLSYPCRYSDMIPRFARPTPVLSMVTNKALDFIYDEHSHRIMDSNHDILDPAHLQTYANAVYAKGAALDNCFGFIDGTVRPIARPDVHQRLVYNGHKRVHALKFQSLALPNGIIGNMYGPVGHVLSGCLVNIVNFFKFIDFKKNLKIGLSSVGKTYIVCAILQNALTCLYGNLTSEYFDLQPPTLQEYFV
ncbi:hypothetical protein QZH41_015516 [Actinostola sp. cb2023]|nr:hypothetical protein QZH41_015516 [Actinostola sp. cb2023]